jgi:lipopolysaccharide biosynthesis glycosyltransferase
MSAKTCVCLLCDEGYLFPTLLAAVQARRAAPPARADVAGFRVGSSGGAAAAFKPVFRRCGIEFRTYPQSLVEHRPIYCARFFLDRMLADDCRDFLYLDGDIQVPGKLDELIDLDIRDLGVAACRDPMVYAMVANTTHRRELHDYFRSIGLSDAAVRTYFNSGVIRASRDVWSRAAIECLQAIDRSRRPFRFPDQDPLNLILNSQCALLATRWNFPVFLKNWPRFEAILPRVVHYMSNPRPWQMACRPWRREGLQPYLDLAHLHPEIAGFHIQATASRRLRYHAQQFYKSIVEGVVWNRSSVFDAIAAADQASVI